MEQPPETKSFNQTRYAQNYKFQDGDIYRADDNYGDKRALQGKSSNDQQFVEMVMDGEHYRGVLAAKTNSNPVMEMDSAHHFHLTDGMVFKTCGWNSPEEEASAGTSQENQLIFTDGMSSCLAVAVGGVSSDGQTASIRVFHIYNRETGDINRYINRLMERQLENITVALNGGETGDDDMEDIVSDLKRFLVKKQINILFDESCEKRTVDSVFGAVITKNGDKLAVRFVKYITADSLPNNENLRLLDCLPGHVPDGYRELKVKNPRLIDMLDMLVEKYQRCVGPSAFKAFLETKSEGEISQYKALMPDNLFAQIKDEVDEFLTNRPYFFKDLDLDRQLEGRKARLVDNSEPAENQMPVDTYIDTLSSPIRKIDFLRGTATLAGAELTEYIKASLSLDDRAPTPTVEQQATGICVEDGFDPTLFQGMLSRTSLAALKGFIHKGLKAINIDSGSGNAGQLAPHELKNLEAVVGVGNANPNVKDTPALFDITTDMVVLGRRKGKNGACLLSVPGTARQFKVRLLTAAQAQGHEDRLKVFEKVSEKFKVTVNRDGQTVETGRSGPRH